MKTEVLLDEWSSTQVDVNSELDEWIELERNQVGVLVQLLKIY